MASYFVYCPPPGSSTPGAVGDGDWGGEGVQAGAGKLPHLDRVHDDFEATSGEHLGFPKRMVIQVAARENTRGGGD